eukprot:TRINITY_DN3724_c0_g1_i3.p1 TRINITY_DN3724_c0_g1~~TRINITY_DN3724_c0_g1_i3.p1  ORF type:complete len:251 (-),score=29.32 TRINITY_DN3724_c0_g1_i3:139-891(-)
MQAHAQIGSPYYVSPEMWKKKPYDTKSDVWAIGCFLYELIALHPPFQARDMEALSKKILTGRYEPLPATCSPDLQKMVRSLLMLEPRARPSVDQIFEMKTVQDHLNLVPATNHTSRPKPRYGEQPEHLDLRNTIGTPRRMGDLTYYLPQEKRYDDSKPAAKRGHGHDNGAKHRERSKDSSKHKRQNDSHCLLPAIRQGRGEEGGEAMERSWERGRHGAEKQQRSSRMEPRGTVHRQSRGHGRGRLRVQEY